ncbi:MAG: type VI secretion system contractile sheath large subunit [Planctomycetales bacterium]|nr:type VI secretion system contractile sheath large subunit [Planctomycetales bacterium]
MNSAPSHSNSQAAEAVSYARGSSSESTAAPSLLDEILHQAASPEASRSAPTSDQSTPLAQFLATTSVAEALKIWLGEQAVERQAGQSWSSIARQVQAQIARIDRLLNSQLTAILHHPSFQKLEASWRGLEYLVNAKEETGDAPIKIRILNAAYSELQKDFDKAVEFDQSQLFQKVYEQEFGTAGGQPFGVLLADYEIHPRPSRAHPYDDMAMLRSFSQVAAAAFCPIVLNASPTMFAHDNFAEMQASADYEKIHQDLSFLSWRSFRETEDSRFIGLAMPRMLLRRHYADRTDRDSDFPFVEQIDSPADCLWGGAAFAMGEVLMRSFAESRWLADIRGVQRGTLGGGSVLGIGPEEFTTEGRQVAEKPLTELQISDILERQMVDLGFLPLCACKDMPLAAFYSCPSTQKPRGYHDADANVNAQMSAMLNYMLCVSRFAHYVKVIGRDKIGSFIEASELQQQLQNWINGYVTADSEADARVKARYPLREADLQVVPIPGKPGAFDCMFRLAPHYELEDMQASIQLRTELIRRG